MKKISSVEWLINEIQSKHDKSFIEFYGSEISQAKEMEREQIIAAYRDGRSDQQSSYQLAQYHRSSENYYTQTYGKKFLDLVSPETSQVHEVVKKIKEKKNNEQ